MFANREGQPVPNVTFKIRRDGEWAEVTSDDLFKGRTVVVFALPGAFTPTCSSAHVPRYNELAPVFHANGVDEIVCISVNDAFVMDEWQRDQGAGRITFLPDGNGEFSEAMGMLVDKSELGFGRRSWRYSMLVRDGIIEKMFIEPDVPGDPYEVSDADTMLGYLNPEARRPAEITLFTKAGCPYCARAKDMLRKAGYGFEEIQLGRGVSVRSVRAVAGQDAVPQVFIDGERIGGSEALAEWLARQEARAA
ncbi:MAG: glutathione peroxidase [Gammaproteobacteria bacterium]|nr:glutathione peroxidase [Gammaproteobacteria bacterium]NIR97160.1 glutathione peroxidase [Gammaproteobacteria bacterium]NIT62858.1 glutathione peroxidase [Gammaproteobacteria bacterium]NIV19822.1 redoxin family protein [Gammaproteobacteria bacterium]NIX11355.1 redoxin family protein [Gammaproteobacteria bacterium]